MRGFLPDSSPRAASLSSASIHRGVWSLLSTSRAPQALVCSARPQRAAAGGVAGLSAPPLTSSFVTRVGLPGRAAQRAEAGRPAPTFADGYPPEGPASEAASDAVTSRPQLPPQVTREPGPVTPTSTTRCSRSRVQLLRKPLMHHSAASSV